jgi:SAM-dependent methyltransferase
MAYTADYYDHFASGSKGSAQALVPIVLDLTGGVASVLDVGCGIGLWLAEWSACGVPDVVGVDGDYVSSDQLLIDQFVPHDLTTPLNLGRKFDLVTSLEVAEHLDASVAAMFVKSLCDHATETILFSAAVPGQGGEHHVNEQWPSYWRPIFEGHGFEVFDVLRPMVWTNEGIKSYYRQNALLYARGKMAERLTALESGVLLDVVHPAELERLRLTRGRAVRELIPSPILSIAQRARNHLRGSITAPT